MENKELLVSLLNITDNEDFYAQFDQMIRNVQNIFRESNEMVKAKFTALELGDVYENNLVKLINKDQNKFIIKMLIDYEAFYVNKLFDDSGYLLSIISKTKSPNYHKYLDRTYHIRATINKYYNKIGVIGIK